MLNHVVYKDWSLISFYTITSIGSEWCSELEPLSRNRSQIEPTDNERKYHYLIPIITMCGTFY